MSDCWPIYAIRPQARSVLNSLKSVGTWLLGLLGAALAVFSLGWYKGGAKQKRKHREALTRAEKDKNQKIINGLNRERNESEKPRRGGRFFMRR